MAYIYIGMIVFAIPHLFSLLFPAVRNRLMARLGEGSFKGNYSLASLLGLILMGYGYWQERHGEMAGVTYYEPAALSRHGAMGLVLLAFILIASNGGQGYIRKWLRHPFSIGVALWATAHLCLNGEIYVAPIFAMFLVLAVLDIGFGFARNGAHRFQPQIKRDGIAVVAGLTAFTVFAFGFHPYVLGLPVVR